MARGAGPAARRWRGRASLCGLALVFVACGGDPRPSLVDDAGVVTDHAFHFEPSHLEADDGLLLGDDPAVVAGPVDGADLRVWWYGTPCQTAPTVTLDEREQGLEVIVEDGPQVGLRANEGCPAVGVPHALDLVLEREVSPADVQARYAPRD